MTRSAPPSSLRPYIGRFAPSPSGPLHMGSLVCALASFLDAKANQGKWLLRIEDIDPPREQAGADKLIMQALRDHGLAWDGEVSYQSQHSERYYRALDFLKESGLSYPCVCTRKRVAALGKAYDQHCLGQNIPPEKPQAIRLNMAAARQRLHLVGDLKIEDRIQAASSSALCDDIIIHRKDGLFAYQLAVVVDDIAQNITDIVRGYDLFDMTASQGILTLLLGGNIPDYAHIPVLVGKDGCKLSKQSHAQAINSSAASKNLCAALAYLQHPPPSALRLAPVEEILTWAVDAWTITKLKAMKSVTLVDVDSPSTKTTAHND